MIQNNDIKNLLITSDTIPSQNLVIAEWNMNRYQVIDNYGLYVGKYNQLNSNYQPNTDNDIKTGKLYLVYDDNSYKVDENDQYYSTIASVFESDRPDPGIILLTYLDKSIIALEPFDTKVGKLNSASPRFYPFSKSRTYDYFNSGRIVDPEDKTKVGITADGSGGAIENCNIFVVYENSFPCNKIVIKMQDYRSVPDTYAIDILKTNNQWEEVFFKTNDNDIVNGILEIYYEKISGNDVWSTVPTRVTDLNEIENPSTQLKTIKGIRFRVGKMTVPSKGSVNYRSSLELIEISPRIEADVTDYTENITIQSSISDGELGLPVGNIVSGNGSILLSNEDGFFLLSSKAAEYKMLSPEVEFKIYQVMQANSQTYNIPLKVMYSDSWTANDDFTTTVSLVDRMKLLSEKNAVDMSFVSKDGIPMSALILFLLDNCGVTGYQFKKSSEQDDTMIKTFFCKKEETITEVLQKLAIATQSSIFIDAFNNLNVFTKEKLTKIVSNSNSDYWMIMDEDYNGYTASNQFSNYLANVISTNDEKITPLTDGKIEYHAYGINKSAGYSLLQDIEIKDYLQDTPFLLLTGAGYGPKFTRVWSADQTKESVFGAGALTGSVSNARPKNIFSDIYTASTYDAAVSTIFSASCLGNSGNNATNRQSLLIPIDNNDIYLFDPFKGYVMIDQEIIAYNGKVFSVNGRDKILFSKEQLQQEIINASAINFSIIPKALVVDLILNNLGKDENNTDLYKYKVRADGRAQFETEIDSHVPDLSSYIDPANLTSFIIGSTSTKRAPDSTFFRQNIQKYYDFTSINNWNKLRTLLGFSESFKPRNYNGLLKLSGPPIPIDDRRATSGSAAIEQQNKINKDISANINDFGPFVYTNGERNVYIQKINNFNFNPSVISARLKLLSSKESQTYSGPEISAHSSIAGIGFALKTDGDAIKNGYFLEVESFGSAGTKEEDKKDKNARASNIRFYRVTENDAGKLIPDVLAVARANIMPSLDTSLSFNPNEPPPADQIVTLEIRISLNDNGKHKFAIYYGNKKIKFVGNDNESNYIDNEGNIIDADNTIKNIWSNAQNIFMFVRNDSSVVFDYMLIGLNPDKDAETYYSLSEKNSEIVSDYQNYLNGSYPNKNYLFDGNSQVKYYDFANVVREVKKYTIRYDYPVVDYKLIDISRVNPKYLIKKKDFTSMGAEIVVLNTANEPISLGENSSLPLFIVGTQIEEITKGEVTMKGFYDKSDEFGKKQVFLSFNKSVYGEKTFNFSSDFIQSMDQANQMMKWVIANCSRERLKMSMEIMFNPLLELGDKVKVFSSSRGYYEGYQGTVNTAFGNKTFTISEINHSISTTGVSTNVTLIEVGE